LLIVLLEHLRGANIQPDAITLLCMPPSSGQSWLDDLPDEFQDVHIEVHQPDDRRKLAYLATTKENRRIYLNRTAVDADQFVVLTRRGYDPGTGYAGGELALFPGLCDEATLADIDARNIQQEAREVAWLMGAPFFIQVIDGPGDAIDTLLCGPLASMSAGERALDECWRVTADRCVDVVIASISGDPTRHTSADFARAFHAAAQLVKPGGSIVLLTEAAPSLSPGLESFRQYDDPGEALSILVKQNPPDLAVCSMWATAANQAKLYLLSGIQSDIAEELFTIPLQSAAQVRNLLKDFASCVLLPDAHKMFAVDP
jgi:nickel-dependent lactate racemase